MRNTLLLRPDPAAGDWRWLLLDDMGGSPVGVRSGSLEAAVAAANGLRAVVLVPPGYQVEEPRAAADSEELSLLSAGPPEGEALPGGGRDEGRQIVDVIGRLQGKGGQTGAHAEGVVDVMHAFLPVIVGNE